MLSVQNDLADALKRLPLRRLRLYIDCTQLDPTPSHLIGERIFAQCYGDPTPPHLAPAPITDHEQSLRSVDLDAYVRDLVSAIPSLEDVIVFVAGERDDESVYRRRVAELVRGRKAVYADREMYEW